MESKYLKTKDTERALAGEGGSASVLIILMMVLLISMGYFAIASAVANTRHSAGAAEWKSNFFYLDGQGEEFIAHVDRLLLSAQESANEYFLTGAYRNFTHPDLVLEKQTFIQEGFANTAGREAFLEQVIDMLFFFYAERELRRLSDIYPGAVVSVLESDENSFVTVRGLICDITLTHPRSPGFHLSITVSVNSHSAFREEHRWGSREASRYRITGWLQWQSPGAEEGMGNRLWDGRAELP